MPRDMEDRLRQSLAARATDVTPDPATWNRVQARIRRGRAVRLAFAGVAGALAIGGIAVAAPALINNRIELMPGPNPGAVASQPPASETPAPGPVASEPVPGAAAEMIFTDGGTVYRMTIDGESADELFGSPVVVDCSTGAFCGPVFEVAAATTAAGVDAVGVEACDGLRSSATDEPVLGDTCPISAVFSPDGKSLAWIGQGEGGAWGLFTRAWSPDGPGEQNAEFGLPWRAEDGIDLQDWVWTSQDGTTATGYVILRVRIGEGIQLQQMQIERQADGEIATTGEAGPLVSAQQWTPLAFAAADATTTYLMELDLAANGPAAGEVVRWTNGEPDGAFELPPALYDVRPFDEKDLWMSASSDGVLLGNRRSAAAWWLGFDDPASKGPNAPSRLDGKITDAVVLDAGSAVAEPNDTDLTTVSVFFGMTGADACVAEQPVGRQVEGAGVARGALTALLGGPTSRESNKGVVSPFSARTAGALNDITIVDGQARVDFRDFSADVGTDSCTKGAIFDGLEKTLAQFPTITSTRYSFDGSTEAWDAWWGSDTEHPAPPAATTQTADKVRAAAEARSWRGLRDLMPGDFACAYSDQPVDCVAFWKDLEDQGEDPLGTLVELLGGQPARMPDTPMWVWPAEFAAGGYSGARTGIAEDGTWRYYNQPGG